MLKNLISNNFKLNINYLRTTCIFFKLVCRENNFSIIFYEVVQKRTELELQVPFTMPQTLLQIDLAQVRAFFVATRENSVSPRVLSLSL